MIGYSSWRLVGRFLLADLKAGVGLQSLEKCINFGSLRWGAMVRFPLGVSIAVRQEPGSRALRCASQAF